MRWPRRRTKGLSVRASSARSLRWCGAAERLVVRQEFGLVVVTGEGLAGAGLSLEAIELSDREGEEGTAVQQLSHQLR